MPLNHKSLIHHNVTESEYEINYHLNGDCSRIKYENFVKDIFKQHYQVELNDFYPLFLSLNSLCATKQQPSNKNIDKNIYDLKNDSRFVNNKSKKINAVAGIRSAADSKFFSEYYLNSQVEDYVRDHLKQWVLRKHIVEVGNFTPADIKQVPALITAMTGFLYGAGFSCVVFTGVPWVSTAFKRMGLPLHQIAHARANLLPDKLQQQWGENYYQYEPKVYLGDIQKGYQAMQRKFTNSNHKLSSLWLKSIELGQKYQSIKIAA